MARDLTAGVVAQLDQRSARPVYLVEALFDPPLRLWTGVGVLRWDGKDWTGSGDLLQIRAAEETQALRATNAVFVLNLFNPALLALIASEPVHGTTVRIYYAYLDENDQVIADPYQLFLGELDAPETSDEGDQGQIRVSGENALAVLFRNAGRRYTREDQAIEYPGDTFFDFVTEQARPVIWRG